ncbi:MAG: bacterioferritin, partial [Planctomycetota bacterium]
PEASTTSRPRGCADWGYRSLAAYSRAEAIDEMRHAEAMMDRVLFLEGVPNMQRYFKIQVGRTVKEQFRHDLALEVEAVKRLNKGIALCRDKGDNTSREILEGICKEEEHHIDWLETQLSLMKEIGEQNYLSQKLGEDAAGHDH